MGITAKVCRTAVLMFVSVNQLGIHMAVAQTADLQTFFHSFVGLNDDQIRDISQGHAVAKVLDTPIPAEVFIFGAVYVNSTPDRYLQVAEDIDALRKLPNYLALRKFSDPPQLSDLNGFTLDDADIKDLEHCKPGQCEVQLPTDAMQSFQQSVNWSAPDRAAQVNHL